MIPRAIECGCADQDRHPSAVLAKEFLLVIRHLTGCHEVANSGCTRLPRFLGCHVGPEKARLQIVAFVFHHPQKRVVGIDEAPVQVPDHDADDVGIDQATNPHLALFELVVQSRILKGDRGLRGQQFEDRQPFRSEDVRGEVVLEIEQPDALRLMQQRQAKDGTGLVPAEIVIG